METYRTCKKCGVEKPLENFCKRKHCKNGRTYACKVCDNALRRDNAREYYKKYRSENTEEVRAYNKKYMSEYRKRKHSEETELRRKITLKRYYISKMNNNKFRVKQIEKLNILHNELTELLINNPK